jgi:hypothetical protein
MMAMTRLQETFTLYDWQGCGDWGACGVFFRGAKIVVVKCVV